MGERGPSPLVPSLVVAVLGWFIYGSTLVSILENVVSVLKLGTEEEGPDAFSILMLLFLFLLLLVYLLYSFFPTLGIPSSTQQGSSGYDAEGGGIGFGTFLFVSLFFVLCHIFWARICQQIGLSRARVAHLYESTKENVVEALCPAFWVCSKQRVKECPCLWVMFWGWWEITIFSLPLHSVPSHPSLTLFFLLFFFYKIRIKPAKQLKSQK